MSFQQAVKADARQGLDFPGGIVAGASVRTPCGPRRIESLRAGDMVVTRCQGLQPVRMVLTRDVSRQAFLKDPSRAPIRVGIRAVGPMMPQKPVLLAADHKVLVPGYRIDGQPDDMPAFAKAADLVNAGEESAIDKSLRVVTYVHLVFDAHVVFMVDGLPVESFDPRRKTLGAVHPEVRSRLEAAIPELRNSDVPAPAARYQTPAEISFLPAFF